MTLGNMRENGVRRCSSCYYQAVLSAGPRMVRTPCGIVGAAARGCG
jgi:hypothetical protein